MRVVYVVVVYVVVLELSKDMGKKSFLYLTDFSFPRP